MGTSLTELCVRSYGQIMVKIDPVGNPVGNISSWKYFQLRDWIWLELAVERRLGSVQLSTAGRQTSAQRRHGAVIVVVL